MDFRFTEEQERLRQEVRSFLDEELRRGTYSPQGDCWMESDSRDFSRKLGAKGWLGLTWPQEYGGGGRSYLDRLMLTEELLRYGAPVAGHWLAERQIGPSIIRYGSEEQKREFLPGIVRGELWLCVGMSEPGAGSDLASVQLKARQEGDDFVLDGQKIWTSLAHKADYCYLVTRTDPNVPKHKGISEFLVDMKSPGITVRPLINMAGAHSFNEVFFDGVRVPRTRLIGQENRGWYQIASQLDYERAGIERVMTNYPLYQALLAYVQEGKRKGRPLYRDPLVRRRLVEVTIEFEVGRLLAYRATWMLSRGQIPNYEAAMSKLYGSEFSQRLAQAAMEVLGLEGQLLAGSKAAPMEGMGAAGYLYCRAYTIQAGTSEILRNLVAIRGLGLPGG